ncbi:ABC transporter ATP-binding protein [Kytococcus sedentarius]|uniref:ABC-type polysaccharide/polyol phosphate transport system, ATPase component n=1 Tax=Kytococcus sedentarius (strain ATCC 14392 / DSM 20547 / JCM 11482 / CCUG 33030 / NBRC 15357 / NCTC 11040 / CCM 314 / 541) TaxID=478801 RepID=C7NGV6_KYTSD|nr:ABC transporter ATP-binding protein [Kytococcus sedentarius]ACV07628.1 ABC-type polysaccharide/polyol phosphate transport system, ATPase component [Kytococcus sedentarius DSM 20547]QQB63555.1 ABC transporter ATP-binding protein [Kytococcus sedentarius]STX13521.1 Teichoic acids export ATP-binding protein TagH [Kytococcus sedentarius]
MAADERVPTVVVDHVDIHYRIFGTGEHRAAQQDREGRRGALARAGHRAIGGGQDLVHAVRDVSLVAHRGESIGLIGRNGSGKSTLLRAIAGLIPPSSGRIWVQGQSTLLGVNAVLMPTLSGVRNIQIGCQALGMTKHEVTQRLDSIVEFSGLGDAVNLPMKSYSSGMAARLRFAISTAVVPDVLVVDEALATGDADFKERAQKRIAEIRSEAGTVFMVSHSNAMIRKQCDRAIWMDTGRVHMDGPVEEVLSAYEKAPRGPRKKG